MITVKNLTKQGREVIFKEANGYKHHWLKSHDSVTVAESSLTETVKELARRKILKLQTK
tara:strand:+ start:985 stop:1161 length:177 start_codon:yes stop_codon:yes gene_type:complete